MTRSAADAAAAPRPSLLAPAVGIAAAAAIAAPVAFHAMFSGFQDYDDEGYVLIVLREYARGGRLYDEVYSQYGPAYHQVVAAAFRLMSLDFTHEHGRAVVLVLWLLVSAVCAALTYRLTRRVFVAASTQLIVLLALVPLRDEPLHPGGPLCLLVAGAVLAGSFTTAPGWRARWGGAVAGVLLGIAVLTKINVGVFAVVAAGFALLLATPATPLFRAGRAVAAVAFLLLPPALLGPAAAHPDVRRYLAVMIASTVGVAVLSLRREAAPGDARPGLAALAVGLAGVLCLSPAWELWRGTTWRALMDGIVLAPTRHPVDFLAPPVFAWWSIPYAALWLGLALMTGRPSMSGVAARLSGPVCLAVGLAMWVAAAGGQALHPLAIIPPVLWLALAAPPDAPGLHVGRQLLVATAALQNLHAYPVAGSQVAFGTFLAAPVAALLVSDGWRDTARTLGVEAGRNGWRRRLVATGLAVALGIAVLGGVAATGRRFAAEYSSGVPLGLPGAEGVRVPATQAALYHRLTGSLVEHCATFVSQPGFNSLYFFTRMEPPTRQNATAWMLLFDDATQRAIVDRLERIPGPICAVRRQRADHPWRTPLARYIDERFETVFTQDYFEFMLPRDGRRPAAGAAPARPSSGLRP